MSFTSELWRKERLNELSLVPKTHWPHQRRRLELSADQLSVKESSLPVQAVWPSF